VIKCAMAGCSGKVVGGFQEYIDAGNFQDPTAVIPGMRTCWCPEHESDLRSTVAGVKGRFLSERLVRD
jgi:hypothetical protein